MTLEAGRRKAKAGRAQSGGHENPEPPQRPRKLCGGAGAGVEADRLGRSLMARRHVPLSGDPLALPLPSFSGTGKRVIDGKEVQGSGGV